MIDLIFRVMSRLCALYAFRRLDVSCRLPFKVLGKRYINFGENFFAGKHLWLEAVARHGNEKYKPSILIKNNVSINDFVHIAATNYVEIGNDVLIASHVYISDHNHGCYAGGQFQSPPNIPPNQRIVSCDQKVIIGDNVWIGEGVCILPGVTIGNGCVIGANAVVTKDIPENSIAVGVPAKIVKQYNFEQRSWL